MSSISWDGTLGDWSVGTIWVGGHVPGTADIAVFGSITTGTVTIGTTGAEFETLGGVVLDDPSLILSIGTKGTLAVGGTIDFEAGTLAAAGTISGATLIGDGGTLFNAGGTLLNDSIANSVTLAASSNALTIGGTFGFAGAGTLVGLGGTIDFAGNQTLQGGTLIDGSIYYSDILDALGSVTLGSGFNFDPQGNAQLIGSFTNNGTITASELVYFSGYENVVENVLTVSGSSFVNNGSIILVNDILDVTGGTTGQLLKLLPTVNTSHGGQIASVGTIDNSNATIDLTIFGALHAVSFTAVLGGTLLTDGSSALPSTLIGVNVVGPLEGFVYGINVVGSLSVSTPSGGPGQIVLGSDVYQSGASLNFSGSQTLDHATVTLLPVSGGGYDPYNRLAGDPAGTLTLGSSLLVNSTETNPYGYGSQISGAVVINQGTLAAGGGDVLTIGATSFVNNGTLVAGTGGEIILTAGVTAFTTPGSIQLGTGATLALAGAVTLAEVTTIANKIGSNGTLALLGSLDLGGGTLDLPGVNLLLGGTVAHGVIDAGNTVSFDGGTLISATIDGAMTLGGGVVDIVGGLAFGGQDTIVGAGYGAGLASATSLTLNNTLLLVPPETSPYETGPGTFTVSATTLTLGSGVTAEVSGALALVASSIASAGTIALAGSGDSLALDAPTIANTGQISIGTGDTLSLGSAAYNTGGGINVYTGATIQLVGTETTGQLSNLFSSFGNPGYTIDVLGTLLNTGTSFGPGIGDGANTISFNGYGDVFGGTLQTTSANGGTLGVLGATLYTVTVDGPLDVNGYLVDYGSLALDTATGAPGGSLTITDSSGGLDFRDTASTLDHATILVTNTGAGVNFGTTLGFGSSLLFESEGAGDFIDGAYEQISTLFNAGTIVVGAGGLTLGVSTLVNTGSISVGAGDLLSIIGGFPGGPFSLINSGGTAHFGQGATLALAGNVSASAVGALLAGSSGVTLDVNGVLENAGSLLAIGGSTIAAAVLAGDIVGGTISGTPLSLSGELDGVTYDGTLTIGASGLSVVDGLTVNNAAGGSGGTILVPYVGGGYYATQPVLNLLDAETLDNAQMQVTASGFAINDSSAVTFGNHFTLVSDGGAAVTAPTITNAGTIVVAAGASFNLHSDTIFNNGSILVAAGGALGIDVGYLSSATLSVSDHGTIAIAGGGTLEVGGRLTTGGLTTLAQEAAVPGVVVDLTGDIINTGATLSASGLFGTLELAGGIAGGSLVLPSGSAFVGGAVDLDDVAVVGPVTLSATGASLLLYDGTTVRNASGGAGLIIASGTNTELSAGNLINGLGTPTALDDVVIEVTGAAVSLVGGLGSLATLDVTGVATESSDTGSAGIIRVHGAGASLDFAQASLANSGTILVSSGATLGLGVGIAATQSLVLNNTGSINVASGGTIELGGILTTAALETLLGSIVTSGAVVELVGTVINTGNVLDLAAGGSLGNVILDGLIAGGTVVNAGGLLGIGQATLVGATFDGTLPLASGATLTEIGGLTLNDVSGNNPGSIVVSGATAAILTFDPTLTLDHAAVSVSGTASLTLGGASSSLFGEAASSASQVNLGTGLSISDSGLIDVLATAFTDAGTIILSGSHATLLANASTIAVPGHLAVSTGDTLSLFPDYLVGSYVYPAPSFFSAANGSIAIAPGVSLVIGGETTTAGLLSLLGALDQPGGTLSLEGALDNTGTSFAPTPGGILDHVSLGGTLIGGTLVPGDASFTYNNPELVGVTVAGSLALTLPAQVIEVVNGLTFATPGGGPGTIDLLGSYSDSISFANNQSLDNLVVNVAGGITNNYQAYQALTDYATLTLGSGVTINDGGLLELGGAVLQSGATIHVGVGDGLILLGSPIVNSGSIAVAAGGTLELNFPYGSAGVATSFTEARTGHLALAAGSTLVIGGVNTTAQLLTALATISNPGVVVEVIGTLINTGTMLQPTSGTVLSSLILDADVIGGTIADGSGSVSIIGGELDGVTYQGPLTLSGSGDYLNAADGLTLQGTGGSGSGTLAVTGAGDALDFLNDATLDNAILQVGTSAFSVTTSNALPLTLGSGLSVSIASSLLLSGTGINENAPLNLTVAGGTLALGSNSINFDAPVTVGASAALALGTSGYEVYTLGITPLAVTGLGEVTLASGATLEIGGIETPAQIAALAAGLTNGLLELFGTVTNIGSVLAVGAAGPFANVAFSGLIEGGTVTNTAGAASFLQASTFDNATFVGPLNLGSSVGASVALTGSSSLAAIGGGPETININGAQQTVLFAPALSETLDNTLISLGQSLVAAQALSSDSLEVTSGTLVLGAATTLSAGGYAEIEAVGGATESTLVNRGLITVSQGNLVFFGGLPNSYYAGFGSDSYFGGAGSLLNAGVIAAGSSAELEFLGSFTNTGTIALSQNALALFEADPLGGGVISFAGAQETVYLAAPGLFTATFQNFIGGNTLELSNLPFASSAVSTSFTNGTLTVSAGTVAVAEIAMTGSIAYAAGDFTPTQDAFGNTEIVSAAPCFVAGTRLRTETGEVAVEKLSVGDRVVTRSGRLVPIVWIGQRRVDMRRHPNPALVQPVRIRAGAFAEGVPARDLRLSPDHAVWVDGVLIPAYALVNGATILREAVDHAHYFHVELPAHDVVYAEGLTAESYLDTGNRGQFAGATTTLHPNFAPLHWDAACAPLCLIGPEVVRVKQTLLDRAQALGHVRKPALLRVSGGVEVPGYGATRRFLLQPGLRRICLTSEAGVPAELTADAPDRRRLGVAIGGAVLDGRVLRLDAPGVWGPGFWPVEGGRRWTDGNAWLQLPALLKRRVLELQVLDVMQTWDSTGDLPLRRMG